MKKLILLFTIGIITIGTNANTWVENLVSQGIITKDYIKKTEGFVIAKSENSTRVVLRAISDNYNPAKFYVIETCHEPIISGDEVCCKNAKVIAYEHDKDMGKYLKVSDKRYKKVEKVNIPKIELLNKNITHKFIEKDSFKIKKYKKSSIKNFGLVIANIKELSLKSFD
jgi:hypothetical protein